MEKTKNKTNNAVSLLIEQTDEIVVEEEITEELLAEFNEIIEEKINYNEIIKSQGDDILGHYIRDLRNIAIPTVEEEIELAKKVQSGDLGAREDLIKRNLPLVIKMAKKYDKKAYGMTFLDIIAEGNIGLMRAVDKFSLEKGCRLCTYAQWWIRQTIERAIAKQSRSIRIPCNVLDNIKQINKAKSKLANENNINPTPKEIAKEIGKSEITVIRDLQSFTTMSSLDAQLNDFNEPRTLYDIIEDTSVIDLHELTESREHFFYVQKAIETLPETEKHVIKERFGLEDRDIKTLEMIGQEYGVSRERIRQIEVSALKTIKKSVKMQLKQKQQRQNYTY